MAAELEVSVDLDEFETPTPSRRERRMIIRQLPQWREYRKATRFHRRVWRGIATRRECDQAFLTGRSMWERDCRAVREAVILGARTVPEIATRVGLTQTRVTRIVVLEDIRAVHVSPITVARVRARTEVTK